MEYNIKRDLYLALKNNVKYNDELRVIEIDRMEISIAEYNSSFMVLDIQTVLENIFSVDDDTVLYDEIVYYTGCHISTDTGINDLNESVLYAQIYLEKLSKELIKFVEKAKKIDIYNSSNETVNELLDLFIEELYN